MITPSGSSRIATILAAAQRAVRDEAEATKTSRQNATALHQGLLLSEVDRSHTYRFETEYPVTLPPDTPIFLNTDKGHSHGSLVAQSDRRLLLALDNHLGDCIESASMHASPWFIWDRTEERLDAYDDKSDTGLLSLLLGLSRDERGNNSIPSEHDHVIAACTNNRVHFVWGPPGTGKTRSLARVCRQMALSGEKTILLAHSNIAVDEAMLRVSTALEDSVLLKDGRILRIGTPHSQALVDHPTLRPDLIVYAQEPELAQCLDKLKRKKSELASALLSQSSMSESSAEGLAWRLDRLRRNLKELQDLIAAKESALIQEARVLGMTLSRLMIDEAMYSWGAQNILLDESSMAPVPQVFAAAMAASERIHFFGDFRQLPPIHLSDSPFAKEWLGRDIFDVAGVFESTALDVRISRPEVTLLDTQYRMEPRIGDLVNNFAYGGRLDHHHSILASIEAVTLSPPWPEASVVCVDTSELGSVCYNVTTGGSRSRANPLHAVLAYQIIQNLDPESCKSIAAITPYRGQSRLLATLLKTENQEDRMLASTVHRFQGSESDVVIFDLCDSYPMPTASPITGADADTALRLMNVAVSRARGKLFILMDVDFIDDTHPKHSPVHYLLSLLRNAGYVVRPGIADLNTQLACPGVAWRSSPSDAWEDIADASELLVSLPTAFSDYGELIEIMNARGNALRSTVFAPFRIARSFEHTPAHLNLMTPPCGFILNLPDTALYLGSNSQGNPIARLTSPAPFEAFLEQVLKGYRH